MQVIRRVKLWISGLGTCQIALACSKLVGLATISDTFWDILRQCDGCLTCLVSLEMAGYL